jgi:hypothetical protein
MGLLCPCSFILSKARPSINLDALMPATSEKTHQDVPLAFDPRDNLSIVLGESARLPIKL